LQDEITRIIAGALEPELLKFERNRIANQPQHNEDAYELYQRGMFHHYRHTKEDNSAARGYFQRALAIDPDYPQAMAAAAIAVLNAANFGWAEDTEKKHVHSYELAQRAVALDGRYPNARYALGCVYMWTSRSDRALVEFKEAIKLNPSFAAAHVALGQMYLYGGRPEEAIVQIERGLRLSPSDPRLFLWLTGLAGAYYQLRDYDRAIDAGRRSWTLNRNWPWGMTYAAASLGQLGRIDEAQAALTDLRQALPNLSFVQNKLLYKDSVAIDHILSGLRKAGFE